MAFICSQKMVWIKTYKSGTHKGLSFLGHTCPNQIFQFRPRRVDRIRAKLHGMGTFTFDYTFDTCPGVKTLYQVQVKVPPKNNVLASPMIFFPLRTVIFGSAISCSCASRLKNSINPGFISHQFMNMRCVITNWTYPLLNQLKFCIAPGKSFCLSSSSSNILPYDMIYTDTYIP